MSLLELMLVISITMILMTLGVPSLLDSKQQLHIKQAHSSELFLYAARKSQRHRIIGGCVCEHSPRSKLVFRHECIPMV
ncbi:type II secretion system protein [Paraglaciecola sp. Hal342]